MQEEAEELDLSAAGPEYDEHVWTSPPNAQRIVTGIADALGAADADNLNFYQENTDAYLARLVALDSEFQAVVDAAARKTLIFADRFPFRYFADASGLDYYAAFPGCSTETEPSAATVAFLIDQVKAEQIPVVFFIEFSNEKMADTICEATGARKLLLHACHNISKSDFESGVSYLTLMTQNVQNLKEALQ
jgi:zinc transport system substrate-binding protein